MSTFILRSLRLSLLVCASAIIGQPSVTSVQQPNAWQRYKAEGFSVLLPEHPATMEVLRFSKLHEKLRTGRLFTAYNDEVVYVVLAFDNPKHRDPLTRFVKEIEEYNTRGKAERFKQDLTGAGYIGKEYEFGQSPTLNGIVRFYFAKDRVYIVEAFGDDISKPSVRQFLDSFAIGNEDAAISIFYEPLSVAEPSILSAETNTSQAMEGVFTGKAVTQKARVLLKPEPMYTESARQAQVTGTVVLRAVFRSSGNVTNLRAVSGLPYGLTEQAIKAARNIRFIPATKDGQAVSMYIQLEYNFNLY